MPRHTPRIENINQPGGRPSASVSVGAGQVEPPLEEPPLEDPAHDDHSHDHHLDEIGELVEDPDELLRHDASAIAEASGGELTSDEAEAILEAQRFSTELARAAVASGEGDFAGTGMDGTTATLMFKGEVPATIRDMAQGADVVFVENVRFSQLDLIAYATVVMESLNDRGVAAQVGVDTLNQVLDVTVESAGDRSSVESAVDDASARASLLTLPELFMDDVRIKIGLVSTVTPTVAYGGDRYWAPGGCTTGFSAERNDNGKRGVLGAEHCHFGNGLQGTYHHEFGAASHSQHNTTDRLGYYDTAGDFEFRTTAGVERDDFYFNAGSLRDVSDVKSLLFIGWNHYYCSFGRTTNVTKCGNVAHIYMSANSPLPGGGFQQIFYTWMLPVGPLTLNGDSGGPWFDGTEAVGLTAGKISGGIHDVFSSASEAERMLNVTIMR